MRLCSKVIISISFLSLASPLHLKWNSEANTSVLKSETAAKYGEDQVKTWRRAYDIPPPEMDLDNPDLPANDPIYAVSFKLLLFNLKIDFCKT